MLRLHFKYIKFRAFFYIHINIFFSLLNASEAYKKKKKNTNFCACAYYLKIQLSNKVSDVVVKKKNIKWERKEIKDTSIRLAQGQYSSHVNCITLRKLFRLILYNFFFFLLYFTYKTVVILLLLLLLLCTPFLQKGIYKELNEKLIYIRETRSFIINYFHYIFTFHNFDEFAFLSFFFFLILIYSFLLN